MSDQANDAPRDTIDGVAIDYANEDYEAACANARRCCSTAIKP